MGAGSGTLEALVGSSSVGCAVLAIGVGVGVGVDALVMAVSIGIGLSAVGILGDGTVVECCMAMLNMVANCFSACMGLSPSVNMVLLVLGFGVHQLALLLLVVLC